MDPEGVFSARADSQTFRSVLLRRGPTSAQDRQSVHWWSSVVISLGPPSVAVRAPAKALAIALRPASAHLACSRVSSTLIGKTAAASESTATRVSTAAETGLAVPTKSATSDRRRAV